MSLWPYCGQKDALSSRKEPESAPSKYTVSGRLPSWRRETKEEPTTRPRVNDRGKPIDQDYWEHVRVTFQRHKEWDEKAHLDELRHAMEEDELLARDYGVHHREVVSRMGNFNTWVTFEQFKHHCEKYSPSWEAAKRQKEVARKNEERSHGTLGFLTNARREFMIKLRLLSDDYEEEADGVVGSGDGQASGLGASGSLDRLGSADDAMRQIVQDMEESIRREREQREALGVAEREAKLKEIEERMEKGDYSKRLAERLAPLSAEQVSQAQALLDTGGAGDIVVKGFNVDLSRNKLRTLRPGTWLNDEVGRSQG
jgi:hypothetical protein